MVSEEKLSWIRENLNRGDLKLIHARLKGIKYETVRGIINGSFYGKHGDVVVIEAMDYLNERLKKVELERTQMKELRKRFGFGKSKSNVRQ